MTTIPRPPSKEPEWVGPDTRREDMTGVSERKLSLRAVHEALLTRNDVLLWIQQHDRLAHRVTNLETRQDALVHRVNALESAQNAAPKQTDSDSDLPNSYRDKESSIHDFDSELAKMRKGLRDKVVDPHHPISESSALALIKAENARVEDATELGTWRAIKRFFLTTSGKAINTTVKLLVGGGVGWLIHHLLAK